MSDFKISKGQRKYLRNVSNYGFIQDHGSSWFAAVRYGFRSYREHRRVVRELGDWLPWHDRPENQPPVGVGE